MSHRHCTVLCEQSEAAVQLGQQHANHPWGRKYMLSAHNAGQAGPILMVSKCAHSLVCHHHTSWDPIPATNLNPRLVSVLMSHGPDMHSIHATIMLLSFYTLVCWSCHFHLFGLIKPWYPQDPHLYFIYPSHLLSFLHFLCTRNLLCCFISSSSQFWTFQCKS